MFWLSFFVFAFLAVSGSSIVLGLLVSSVEMVRVVSSATEPNVDQGVRVEALSSEA